MPTSAVHSIGSPRTSTGTSPAKALGRVAAGPSDRRATPPGTSEACGQTSGACGLLFFLDGAAAPAGSASKPRAPSTALRRFNAAEEGRSEKGRFMCMDRIRMKCW
ncbi:hypothetical protein D9M69_598100 [compost metagenome]